MLYTIGLEHLLENGTGGEFTALLTDVSYRPASSDALRDIAQARGMGYEPRVVSHRIVRSPVGVMLQLAPAEWRYSTITAGAVVICIDAVPLIYTRFPSPQSSFGGDFVVEFSPLMLS